ncbi:MAG TPA: Hsp20/alpha crystallin family protein, partial [Candidatus Coatesbacteria bacterium]|nr:Hsp20/alpha crystallin family protein [Candidatus Coatesbacteria bacterium]
MAIVRWTPNRHWMSLQEEMNRLFEDFVGPSSK